MHKKVLLCKVKTITPIPPAATAATKSDRHRRMRTLITDREISTQGELVKLLKKEGFDVTQSSVSRDLEELGVAKAQGYYVMPGAIGAGPQMRLTNVRTAGDALIVLKCEPGFASAISAELDRHSLPGVVGTLAGDDTIFIAVSGRTVLMSTVESIQNIFPL